MSRYLWRQPPLRIWVLPTVLFLILKEWEVIPPVQWRKISKPCSPKDLPSSRSISQHWLQFPCSYRVSADLETVSCLLHNLLMVSQLVSQPGAASVSSGSGSARSWNVLGHSHWVSRVHGLGSSDDNRNTRRRLDTFSSPEDEQARSAILLQFPCEQYHKGVTKWINSLWEDSNMPAFNKPVRIHCKAGSVSVRVVLETPAKCQDFVARYKDDGIPCEIDSPFCCASTTITVRQSRSLEDREDR